MSDLEIMMRAILRVMDQHVGEPEALMRELACELNTLMLEHRPGTADLMLRNR